jgi:MerR family transcriptional regulator, heat shock protein HspR
MTVTGFIYLRYAGDASTNRKFLLDEGVRMAKSPNERARGVYGISVAAELTGAGVQNLRVYERHGLIDPDRTEGGTRRYSEDDLDRVRRVLTLLEKGLNLAGIALVLELEEDNARL